MTINFSTIKWDYKETILEHGEDYLKNNLSIMNNYKDIWETAKKVLPNSSSEKEATRNFVINAEILRNKNKQFLKNVSAILNNSCNINANSAETRELKRIYSIANVANVYFESVVGNEKLLLSGFRALTTSLLALTLPLVLISDYDAYKGYETFKWSLRDQNLHSGAFTLGFTACALFANSYLKYRENSCEKKMYYMHKLLTAALNTAEVKETNS